MIHQAPISGVSLKMKLTGLMAQKENFLPSQSNTGFISIENMDLMD